MAAFLKPLRLPITRHARLTLSSPSSLNHVRLFQTKVQQSTIPDFGFAFDIDGVLLRSSTPLPNAHSALSTLLTQRIPFILLTNGGGKPEAERVADLEAKLEIPLSTSMFVQSHTPFAGMTQYHDKTVLVVGGDYNTCQRVAEGYGFKHVVTPADIYTACPEVWPFGSMYKDVYKGFAKPLPKPVDAKSIAEGGSLKIDAIFVYNDPRDWGLDATVILDLMLSRQGILGTISEKNGDASLPNNGYLQDGQPKLYYSNPDLWWAASYHLNRLGQGGFQHAFQGLWREVTNGAKLEKTVAGKPTQLTFEFAEDMLRKHRKAIAPDVTGLNDPLRRVYMVGDNPESDIRGANNYKSPHGSQWTSILVKTGVWKEGKPPSCTPHVIKEDVLDAVQWAVADARARGSA